MCSPISNAVRIHRYVSRCCLCLGFHFDAMTFRCGITGRVTRSSRGRSVGNMRIDSSEYTIFFFETSTYLRSLVPIQARSVDTIQLGSLITEKRFSFLIAGQSFICKTVRGLL